MNTEWECVPTVPGTMAAGFTLSCKVTTKFNNVRLSQFFFNRWLALSEEEKQRSFMEAIRSMDRTAKAIQGV